ncbi:STAS domain-containing protein [Echinimonas agarilytica]|uniref:STAS domain-containing protein n=1 Tax=Echinimonas agarilytica TaxID=1215918 RepID=A0AA42B6D0_9GAMM|nr:STAS domain-containing protein [Echinimonas agarilytica]MCM2678622.1 STAS domain-containing protein [Echinimonas agarilytica]
MTNLSKHSEQAWTLIGNIDRHTLPKIWADLNKLPNNDLVVDLSQVDRVDGAGLAGLVRLKMNAELQNIQLSFTHAPIQLLHLAELSNVDTMLSPA